MRYWLMAGMGVVMSASALAGSVSSAKVNVLMQDKAHGNRVYIELSKQVSSAPACHHHGRWTYVLDTSTKLGEHLYSSLLTLYATQKLGSFQGTNSCLHNGIEELRRIEMH